MPSHRRGEKRPDMRAVDRPRSRSDGPPRVSSSRDSARAHPRRQASSRRARSPGRRRRSRDALTERPPHGCPDARCQRRVRPSDPPSRHDLLAATALRPRGDRATSSGVYMRWSRSRRLDGSPPGSTRPGMGGVSPRPCPAMGRRKAPPGFLVSASPRRRERRRRRRLPFVVRELHARRIRVSVRVRARGRARGRARTRRHTTRFPLSRFFTDKLRRSSGPTSRMKSNPPKSGTAGLRGRGLRPRRGCRRDRAGNASLPARRRALLGREVLRFRRMTRRSLFFESRRRRTHAPEEAVATRDRKNRAPAGLAFARRRSPWRAPRLATFARELSREPRAACSRASRRRLPPLGRGGGRRRPRGSSPRRRKPHRSVAPSAAGAAAPSASTDPRRDLPSRETPRDAVRRARAATGHSEEATRGAGAPSAAGAATARRLLEDLV